MDEVSQETTASCQIADNEAFCKCVVANEGDESKVRTLLLATFVPPSPSSTPSLSPAVLHHRGAREPWDGGS